MPTGINGLRFWSRIHAEKSVLNLSLQIENLSLQILFFNNLSKIKLYLPFSDWFGVERNSVLCQINRRKSVIWIQLWFGLTWLRKDFFMCMCIVYIRACLYMEHIYYICTHILTHIYIYTYIQARFIKRKMTVEEAYF